MSERDIRETLDLVTQELMQIAYNDMILSAVVPLLEEPPDLVAVLRMARQMYDGAWESFNSGKQLCGMAIADALLHIIEYIEDEAGIRLTDDGWEYVKKEEETK